MLQRKGWSQRWQQALDLVFPPKCPTCDVPVDTHGTLCRECWNHIHFISAPFCACCGYPFSYSMGEGTLCGSCIAERPSFTQARSVMRYDEFSRSMILGLKYADKTHMAPIYGEWMANTGLALLQETDAIIPVPLHFRRLLERKFNQSGLLASVVGKMAKTKVYPDALQRMRHTESQTELTRLQRLDNVRGAFRVHSRYSEALKGKNVLLIDDVMTTLATVEACSRALRDAEVKDIYVLTLARTVHSD